ncbi:MAG: hypothetical protein PHU63_00805 [Candidatus ainarchaeum sp.]|nr:hypothetical protein [Candidatus ainarchaeum sp.]
MKIKLNPELSYIIGFWRKRKSFEGIGIIGEKEDLELFSKEVLEKKLTSSKKLLSGENKIYFYHTAYKKFFKEIEDEQCERFKYLNDYSASYLAGTFDSCGEIDLENGIILLGKAGSKDEVLLSILGFRSKWKNKKLIIIKPKAFLRFIKNYVKRYQGHKIFDLI